VTAPLIDIDGVTKAYGGLRPLRVRRLRVGAGERLALSGLDAAAAETLVHLITGASVPDEGAVLVAGRDTREIATDTEWLTSLDRFGIVTRRAVLIEALPLAANLALPMTLAIEPMSHETRVAVERLAAEVGLAGTRLDEKAGALSPHELVRVHLARALATHPQLLLLEHPTADVRETAQSESLGKVLADVAASRQIGWLAITEDDAFAHASGSRSVRLKPATGEVSENAWWKRLVR
jgi:predicted ABC-type transport system involved in lysophospholipase L1 biosynthesis ATPase subunit